MKYLKILFSLALIAIPIALIIVLPQKIKIKEIDCKSQFGPCNSSILASISTISNEPRTLKESKDELKNIFSDNILVRDYSLHYQFPDIIEVNILERKPKYAIKVQGLDSYALIDEEGYVLYFLGSTGLPFLIMNEAPPNAGEQVPKNTSFALELLYGAFSAYQIREGKIENNGLVIELSQGPRVIFPLEGDRDVLLGSLRIVLSKLNNPDEDSKIENVSGVSIIDLRYKNPVIK